jgi:crossover junction endodeoxyribonuclease RusA
MTGNVAFDVLGIPAPQGSKSFKGFAGNGRAILVESSKKLKPWRERGTLFARQAMADAGHSAPFGGPVTVDLAFVMPRPKSAPKSRVIAAVKRPDIDKLARGCLDFLTGTCVADDSQVVGLKASKRIALPGEQPGVHITVTEGESTA